MYVFVQHIFLIVCRIKGTNTVDQGPQFPEKTKIEDQHGHQIQEIILIFSAICDIQIMKISEKNLEL